MSQKLLWKTDFKDKEMRREEGGAFRMGDTCTPWLIHVNVW